MGYRKKCPILALAGILGITWLVTGVPMVAEASEGKRIALWGEAMMPESVHMSDTTTMPEATAMPEATTKPEVTTIPEATVMPEVTTLPEATAMPEATTLPEVTESPMGPSDAPASGVMPTGVPSMPIPTPTSEITMPTPGPESPVTTGVPATTILPPTVVPASPTQTPVAVPSETSPAIQEHPEDKNEEYCVLSYRLNGGRNHKKNPAKIKKKASSAVALYPPQRPKHAFLGWYLDAKYAKKVTSLGNTDKNSITLYARWKKVTVGQVKITMAKKQGSQSIMVLVSKEAGVQGFEYVYAFDKYFKRKNRLRTKKNPKTLTKLTKKKTYYIKVRAYKTDSMGKKIYGIYSKARRVKL